MRYFTLISIITLISFGASGSSSTHTTYISDIKPFEYTSLIKTSEEMYKTSEELLNQIKNLP